MNKNVKFSIFGLFFITIFLFGNTIGITADQGDYAVKSGDKFTYKVDTLVNATATGDEANQMIEPDRVWIVKFPSFDKICTSHYSQPLQVKRLLCRVRNEIMAFSQSDRYERCTVCRKPAYNMSRHYFLARHNSRARDRR